MNLRWLQHLVIGAGVLVAGLVGFRHVVGNPDPFLGKILALVSLSPAVSRPR